MAKPPPFDLSELNTRFVYDPETGRLVWAAPKSNRIKAGDAAGTKMTNGYLKVAVYQHQTYVHHIVWYISHGYWPEVQIDHVNGDRSDNRLSNLRLATQTEQNFNTKTRVDNTTGVKGVAICPKTGRYRAYITSNRKQCFLGNHVSFDAAVAARRAAEVEYCGEFIRVVSPTSPQETPL